MFVCNMYSIEHYVQGIKYCIFVYISMRKNYLITSVTEEEPVCSEKSVCFNTSSTHYRTMQKTNNDLIKAAREACQSRIN